MLRNLKSYYRRNYITKKNYGLWTPCLYEEDGSKSTYDEGSFKQLCDVKGDYTLYEMCEAGEKIMEKEKEFIQILIIMQLQYIGC